MSLILAEGRPVGVDVLKARIRTALLRHRDIWDGDGVLGERLEELERATTIAAARAALRSAYGGSDKD